MPSVWDWSDDSTHSTTLHRIFSSSLVSSGFFLNTLNWGGEFPTLEAAKLLTPDSIFYIICSVEIRSSLNGLLLDGTRSNNWLFKITGQNLSFLFRQVVKIKTSFQWRQAFSDFTFVIFLVQRTRQVTLHHFSESVCSFWFNFCNLTTTHGETTVLACQ